MSLAEVESAVMELPEEQRRQLACRIWNSLELSERETEALILECDRREKEAEESADGWMPVDDFMAEMKTRK